MKKPILILIPTRDRPLRLKSFLDSFQLYTEGKSKVCIGVDQDQIDLYEKIPNVGDVVVITRNEEFVQKVNAMYEYAQDRMDFDYVYILSDDFIVESKFENEMLECANKHQMFMGFGDDGLKGESLATAMLMSRNIPDAIGYINPPTLQHLYCDNVWTEWGKKLNCLYYFNNIKMTHNHFTKNPELRDALYEQSNSASVFAKDKQAFDKYMADQFRHDIRRVHDYISEDQS